MYSLTHSGNRPDQLSPVIGTLPDDVEDNMKISIQIPPFQGKAIRFSNAIPMRASALPAVLTCGDFHQRTGRADAMIQASYHFTKSCFDVLIADVVRL